MNVIKIGILFLWIILAVACISKNTNKAILKNEEQIETTEDTSSINSEPSQQQLQLSGLETYLQSTSFSAVISNISIQTKSDEIEDQHTIKAKVEKLFRGEADEYIEFEMITELGELVNFEEKVLICLCQQGAYLFWAGTGSVFPAAELFIAKANETMIKIESLNASFCDE